MLSHIILTQSSGNNVILLFILASECCMFAPVLTQL
jgi:hypothetical protein